MFGQVAISLGYLTTDDVAQLLAEQMAGAKPFLQILVENGIMRADQAEQHYNEYRLCLAKPECGETALPV